MRWISCSLIFLFFLNAQAEDYTTGYQLAHGQTITIYVLEGAGAGTDKWYQVTNSDANNNVFIPSATATEWNAFLAHTPAYVTLTASNPSSCSSIYTYQKVTTDGNYTIDPDGPGGNAPFLAFCDMTQDGGGWTRLSSNSATSDVAFDGTDTITTTNIGQGCGGTTNSVNISGITITHTQEKYILTRTTTTIQCPSAGGTGVATYYQNGGSWVASGTCSWSPPWATAANNISTTGLPLVWKLTQTHSASTLYFRSICSSAADNGQLSLQYFVK